jgi:DNA-binding transcriptional ArsR family regulator
MGVASPSWHALNRFWEEALERFRVCIECTDSPEQTNTTLLQRGLNAISHPTRVAILLRLGDGPLPVVDLASGFSVSRSAISQHLRILKDAGLVHDQQQGTWRVYQVDGSGVAALKVHFDTLWQKVLTVVLQH